MADLLGHLKATIEAWEDLSHSNLGASESEGISDRLAGWYEGRAEVYAGCAKTLRAIISWPREEGKED